MDEQTRRRLTIAGAALVVILAWFRLVDRYPTDGDCAEVASGYGERGYLDRESAAAYAQDCSAAVTRQERQSIVDRMNDEASLNASRR